MRIFTSWGARALGVAGLGVAAGLVSAARGIPSAMGGRATGERRARMEASPHFRDGKFHNEDLVWEPGTRSLAETAGKMISGRADGVPGGSVPLVSQPSPVALDGLHVTWFGHSSALLEVDGGSVLVDPVWSDRVSPSQQVGPKRLHANPVELEDLPRIDAVVISHDHYDHLCVRTLKRLQAHSAPQIVTGLRVGEVLARNGIGNVHELDWWDSVEVAPGVVVVFTPAKHFSGRSPLDLDRRLWGGLYVYAPAGGIYYAGDSVYCTHFRDIRERLGSPRVALLPIGAFEPRWFMSPVHMDPAQAVQAHLDLGAVTSVAVHYGSFALADDEQGQPERELTAALRAQRVPQSRFRMLPHGDAVGLPRGVAELGVDAVA